MREEVGGRDAPGFENYMRVWECFSRVVNTTYTTNKTIIKTSIKPKINKKHILISYRKESVRVRRFNEQTKKSLGVSLRT